MANHHEALGLHFVMFLPTLVSQCDPQQSRKWIPLAQSFRVLGTYAQTEMGHGQSRTPTPFILLTSETRFIQFVVKLQRREEPKGVDV